MKQLLTILLVGLFLQAASCKKYLDKKSDTKLTTIDRLEDLQAILDNNRFINIEVVPVYTEASADDYFLTDSDFFGGGNYLLAYTWKYFAFDYISVNDWEKAYYPVNLANICLQSIDKFPKNATNKLEWDNIKGSALFIRAFNFLNLSLTYSKAYDAATADNDLGIALRLGTDYREPTVRASVAACYKRVISDTREAIFYLPDIAKHPDRPSKAAAYGLLARTYLAMNRYDSAGIYADSALQIRSELIDYNGDADIVNDINGLNPPFRQFNKETIFYADISTSLLYNSLVRDGNVDTTLYSVYAADDLRKTAFFYQGTNGYQKFKGNYAQSLRLFGGIATDELFLTRAECYARKNMIIEAMNDLNSLLIKRWKNTIPYPVIAATDATDALNKILMERRKELLFRGLRWMDIKRLNKEGAAIILKRIVNGQPYELLPNSDKYALPIPEDIIELTGIQQNPGWVN